MSFLALLEAKRDGQALTDADLRALVTEFTAGRIPDYQMAAFLMAVFFRGLTPTETTSLTLAMRDSGEVLRFRRDPRPLVDKHSTGGVGDKVSLPLAPLLACLGFRVPMISGRGLGITGGTLDKLDSIPGFRTLLPLDRIVRIVQEVGCVICGQTERMVPADKALYALRDVTGTVPSIPLIVASILSKKLAEGLDALVLDVKFGAAAFMPTPARARELARAMVQLATQCGVNTHALLTNMDAPLGRAAGNWLEVKEAVACLEPAASGRGRPRPRGKHSSNSKETQTRTSPPVSEDLRQLVLVSAAHLLVQAGKCKSVRAARIRAEECLAGGEPRRKWDEMLAAQGADLAAFRRKLALDHTAPFIAELKAPKGGYVQRCDARVIGEVVRALGGGRLTKDSVLNYDVGVDCLRKTGERVQIGDTLARVHAADKPQAREALRRLRAAFSLCNERTAPPRLVHQVIM